MNIDLRSDSVSKPSLQMTEAMMLAQVGDDMFGSEVFGEDLNAIELEATTAALFGKEAGLFCPTGTMTNQIAIKVHTRPAEELICAEDSHIYQYEGGGIAFNSQVQTKLLAADRGRIKASQIALAINPDDIHFPKTSLVCLENSHNKGGGSVYEMKDIQEIREVCQTNHLPLHLDGARIFNALVAHNIESKLMGSYFDSISVCFSKGLGCPVGSVLLGTKDFIKQAKRVRKLFGGGWRQPGQLAAAGVYALKHHINRLAEDHIRAKNLGDFIKKLPFVSSVLEVETNIVICHLVPEYTANEVLEFLSQASIKAVKTGPQSIRFVTHLQITDEMIARVCEVIEKFEKK